MSRHLTTLDELSAQEFSDLLAVAVYLKRRRAQGIVEHALAGKTLAMIFEKPSLRTRLSFEVGMTELGGTATYIRGEEVGMNTREPIKDIARVLSRYVQGIMLRTFSHANVVEMARHATVPVINGLSDACHPCQALADLLTIHEHLGETRGLKVVFVGDGNNVARSLARACVLSGATFVLAAPAAYAFSAEDVASFGPAWGSAVSHVPDAAAAARGADVLYTDVWTSMGQEAERETRLKDFRGYAIDQRLIALAAPRVKVMHCLPAHRGEEISDAAVEGAQSIVFDQAENRLHAQKAILRLAMADDAERVIAAARATT
ncbi:MAG: ornithine carbamoyltransferase [Planctomycetes bacterium]|nr:ornithine carbamoyltransferase [Planctomycetota bacterium]